MWYQTPRGVCLGANAKALAMNQILNMIIRQVMNRVIRSGIDKGVDLMAKRKGGGAELSAEQQQAANENKKRARQAMRITRRFGR